LALAALSYAQDYDERSLPYSQLNSGGGYRWYHLVEPYIKNTQILKCPSQNPTVLNQTSGLPISYGIIRTASTLEEGGGPSLATIQQPAETFMLADNRASDDENQSFATFYAPPGNTWGSYGTLSPRHNEGANFGFYDGHAKWMSRTAAWSSGYYDYN